MPDPLNDRVVPESLCPRLPNKPLSVARVFPVDESTGEQAYAPDTELIKNFQFAGGLLTKTCFLQIVSKAKSVL